MTGTSGTPPSGRGASDDVTEPSPRLGSAVEEAAVAAWKRVAHEDGPGDSQWSGCLLAFLGMMLLTLTPPLANWIEITPPVARTILGLGVVLLVLGPMYPFLRRLVAGGTPEYLACRDAADWLNAHADEVVGRLESDPVDPVVEEALDACARFLRHAYTVHGPSTTTTRNLDDAIRRLGAGRPILLAVERHLNAESRIYPVLTYRETLEGLR